MKSLFLILSVLLLSSFSKHIVEIGENKCLRVKDTFSIPDALEQIQSNSITDKAYLACLYHQVGVAYYNLDEYILAIKHYEEAIKIREQINDELLWRTNHNIALTYHELNNYKKAIHHNQLAYNIKGVKKSKDSINILRFLSEGFSAIGDIKQAIEYGKKAIKVDADTLRAIKATNALGSILVNSNDTANAKLAISNFNNALKLKKRTNQFDATWVNVHVNKGVAFGILNKNDNALEQYNLALSILPKEDTLSKASIINNKGVELMDQKKYKLALEQIEQSLKLKRAYFLEESFQFRYSANYENMGDCYFKMKNYRAALQNYQTSIINLTNSFRNTNVAENPVLTDSLYVYSYSVLIRVLDAKAKTALALYLQNNDASYLKLAHQTYLTLLDFHNQLQNEIATENSRLFQAKNLLPYIENGLDAVYEMQANGISIGASAFRLMEKNKATVLLQSINESQALQYANLPDTVVEQEGELKTAISFYKKQLNDAKIFEETGNIDRFEKLLFEEENKYTQLIRNLESNYPDYYQLKYQQNEIQLTEAQAYLEEDVAMLEYFIGDSSIYILSIQNEKSKLYKTPKPKNWSKLINNVRQSLTDINFIQNAGQEAFDLFTQSAAELCTILLQKPLTDAEQNIQHLKIIPDAELNYIPFDVLLTETPNTNQINYADLAYLIKKQSLSYAYSVALLFENRQHQNEESGGDLLELYAGFAPVYTRDNRLVDKTTSLQNNIVLRSGHLVDLPNARISVQQIAEFLTGKAFLAKEATKQQFIDKANQFKIIHLATHGFLNDENPLYSNLVFAKTTDSTDNMLYAADLYNIEMNADLVVLSACNTGTGKLQKGEGLMSLSRAFTYAGSKSLVMSLWEVPDKSTSTIMQNFFQQLKKGYSKDDALQLAKIDFINENQDRAHPLYWASFVASGNMVAIDFENEKSNWWLKILIIFAAVLCSGGWFCFSLWRKKTALNWL